MGTDDFILRVKRELRSLARREEDLAKRHEAMVRERASIRTRTSELTRLLGVYQEVMGVVPAEETALNEPAEHPEVVLESPEQIKAGSAPLAHAAESANGTTADISAQIMAAHGGRIKIRTLLDELVRMGKLKGNDGDYGSVFGALKRNPHRFVKVGPGEFALVAPSAGVRPLD
jgi:hypothetical protein